MLTSNGLHKHVLIVACASLLAVGGVTLAQDLPGAKAGGIRVAQLRPAPDTEVRLSEAFLTRDDQGRVKLGMSGPLPKNQLQRLFWLVDPATDQYTVLRLTGQDTADANRIARAYNARGVPRQPADFVTRLREGRIAAEERFSEGKNRVIQGAEREAPESAAACSPVELDDATRGPRVDEDAQFTHTCQGYGNVEVELWELAKRIDLPVDHLNETNIEVRWIHDTPGSFPVRQYYSVDARGSCWAKAPTFFGTHWYINWCSPTYRSIYADRFDTNKVGYYLNVDFLPVLGRYLGLNLSPESVQVVSSAAVQHIYGTSLWGHTLDIYASSAWFQYVGTSFLLSGEISGEAFEYNCLWRCDPPSQEVYDCQNDAEFPGTWDWEDCECVRNGSPIIIDLDSDGLSLTAPPHGVSFDLLANGRAVKVGWTNATANDAFLALDRNGNGTIDDGGELFGDRTAQPTAASKRGLNGFLALGVFDQRGEGGNEDEQISEADAVYQQLRLWLDGNHDGIAQADELSSLPSKGVRSIALRYQPGRKTDEFGNVFRFMSHVAMDHSALSPGPMARQAIDVFLRYARIP